MKQAYILRRDGRDYQAPDLDALRAWARDGRVLPADMVYSPRYQSWYRARDLRELRAVLPSAESVSRTSARQQFWLRKGDQNYATDSLDTILRWAGEGNIDPDDYIYHPSYGKWFRAGDSPQLASRFPAHLKQRNQQYGDSMPMEGLLEGADSTAQTVTDLDTSEVRRGLASAASAASARIGSRATVDIERPRPVEQPVERPSEARTVETVEPVLSRPVAARPVVAEPVAVVEPEPVAVAEPEPELPEPEEDAQPPELVLDEHAKFDVASAFKLFYDVARVFVVSRDVRPGEVVEAECRLPSTGDNFLGQEKRNIYRRLRERMTAHVEGHLTDLGKSVSDENAAGYQLLMARARALIQVFVEADGIVGTKPPERFVIGNRARPKMTPAEEEAMLRIDAALTGVISVRKRKPK